jgi:histidine triad (HIT) family protein
MNKDCVFCNIVAGKEKAYIIDESDLSIVILDINPLQKGHCLAIPKRHIQFWYQMNDEEISDLYRLSARVARRLMKLYKADFITQYARGRRIPHTHIFLIPTFSKDPLDRYFNALEGFQENARLLANLGNPKILKKTEKFIKKIKKDG